MSYIKKTIYQMEMDSLHRAHAEPFMVLELNDKYIEVCNLAKDTRYLITKDDGYIIDCDCPHRFYRHVNCKHMIIASEEMNIPLL